MIDESFTTESKEAIIIMDSIKFYGEVIDEIPSVIPISKDLSKIARVMSEI